MNKKIALLSVFDALATILFPFLLVPFSLELFNLLFSNYDVYRNFSDQAAAQENFSELLKYISFRTGNLSESFFSREDILHMVDVRMIFGACYLLFIVSIVLFTFIKSEKHEKNSAMIYGSIVSMVAVILVGFSVVLFSFDKFFITFHEILFRNNYWLLDPQTSNLIKFFPDEIFQVLLALIGSVIIVISLVTLVISVWKGRGKQQK